jgi:iron(III) transport system permease protein
MRPLLTLICALLALPVLGVAAAWLGLDEASLATLRHQWQTVLPDYAAQSALLALGVAAGVALVGGSAAVLVTLFDFPGRRVFEWALLLPLAMPAYVLAYAATDALQYSGPLQTALRDALGARGALWPEVRSLWGAVLMFVFALFPYVYLLARASLSERAPQLMEAARLLGASLGRRITEVALPLARPALVAGVALALMETLADYGVGAYFGLATFTTGIYKAWLSMNDTRAAAQLAGLLLACVALLLWLERSAQARLRFAASRQGSQHAVDARPLRLRGGLAALAWGACAVPVALGFVLPVGWLVRMLWQQTLHGESGLAEAWLARFGPWAASSFKLAAGAALAATALALALGFAQRMAAPGRGKLLAAGTRLVSLGYALPGAVIAVGILAPLGAAQAAWPHSGIGVLVTGTAFGLVYAYLVRFTAVALQSVESGYARIAPAVDDSARMLGASRWRTWRELHLPLLRRSALAAGLLVFVDVMKELPATLALRPFGTDTLAVVAYNLARDERLGEAALPSLAIVAVGLLPVMLLSRAMRQHG